MLQSSFFGGPRGKDFLVSKILNNAAEAKADLDLGINSDIKVDDYILISYGVLGNSKYQENLGIDGSNYNAKVYQKVIKNDSISSNNNDILGLNNSNNYAYKFIIDLSSQLKINFKDNDTAGDAYSLSYDASKQEYTLKMPKPSINYNTNNGKLTIKLNGETSETEIVTQITENNVNGNIAIAQKISLEFSGTKFEDNFETTLNQKTDFSPEAGNWYLIDCKFTNTSSTPNPISYWTVFAYAYRSKTTNISNSGCIVYSKVSGNAASSAELPTYITDSGISVNGEHDQKTSINKTTGLITTGTDIILPGQIVYYENIPDTNCYISAGTNLYYEPSPLEKKLYEKINTIGQKEVLLKDKLIIGNRAISWLPDGSVSEWEITDTANFYSRTSTTSNAYDVFSNKNTDNYINEKYLDTYTDTLNLYDLTNGLNYDINKLKNYDKIVLTFTYRPKDITTEFYMSLININSISKNRLITLNLSNGFKEFSLVFKKRQDTNFYLSYLDLQDSWKTTFYHDTTLTDDTYSSISIDKLNPFFVQGNYIYLSLGTASGTIQRASDVYYKDFADYFNSLSVTLKGYKN